MKNRTKEEPWRDRCIRLILIEHEEKGFRIVTGVEDPAILLDLCNMGYVTGSEMIDDDGNVLDFRTRGATLAGRLFVEEQQRILDAQSVWGQIKSGAGLALGWIGGVVTSVLVYYITKEG